jgi:1,4-dihydroxy-2-naphthoate polyprenyltransferase
MKHWIQAARLRTLPLSISGIIVGSTSALVYPNNAILTPTEVFSWTVFAFALLTTLGLQILSNFANDYGDGIKGTDNEDRIGPKRTIQSGLISPSQMKTALIIVGIFTFFCAASLIYFAFGYQHIFYSVFFLNLGIFAIAAAIKYTVGKSAYGYRGLGDVFVFIFFGLVSTIGVNFLYTKQLDFLLFLPATAIGLLSVAVLNLNNMRDEASDKKANKNTLVVKMGGTRAKKYHYFLIITPLLLVLFYAVFKNFKWDQYIFVLAYIPILKHLQTVYKNENPQLLDSELKKVAISTFLLSLLLSLGMLFFLSDVLVNRH